MTRPAAAVFMLVFLVVPPARGSDFYDIDRVNTISLFFADSNWDAIMDSLYEVSDSCRLVGTAVINGVQYDSVGVKYKGQSSYNPGRIKNPFNIKLDYVIDGQAIDGQYGTLKLSNVYKDPSFVREVLSYEIARDYMPGGGANFANLYINGDLIGLYVNDQTLDKYFLRTHFATDENVFFKGVVDLDTIPVVWGYFGPDTNAYLDYYELESDHGWPDLIDFLWAFNTRPDVLDSVLAVDELLWMLAFDILMVNLDSPVNTGQNYYLYERTAGQFYPIIWDLNENFGSYRTLANGSSLNLIQLQRLDPFFNSTNSNYPIITKILSDSANQKRYIAHLRTIIADHFSNGWYRSRALEIQAIVDSFVAADPNKFFSYSDFIRNLDYSIGTGPQAIVGLSELMNTRTTFLLGHAALQGSPPRIVFSTYTPEKIYPNTIAWFAACVDSADQVWLAYRQDPGGEFKRVLMRDDGGHNDVAAGDGIYGASIRVGAGTIDYYYYAENSTAASFSPEHAEFEYYSLPLTGGTFIALEAGSPNPFTTSSSITYHIPSKSRATLYIYDVAGRVVSRLVDEVKEAGTYRATFSPGHDVFGHQTGLASGVYFARLTLSPSDGGQAIAYEGTTKLVLIE